LETKHASDVALETLVPYAAISGYRRGQPTSLGADHIRPTCRCIRRCRTPTMRRQLNSSGDKSRAVGVVLRGTGARVTPRSDPKEKGLPRDLRVPRGEISFPSLNVLPIRRVEQESGD
jgi:hypothetical protein